MATLLLAVAVAAQTAAPQQQPRPSRAVPATRAQKPAAPAPAVKRVAATAQSSTSTMTADDERKLLNTYCVSCHNEKAKAALDSSRKLQIDALDPGNVHKDGEKWELIVRKLRAGMMPPAGIKRPEPAVYDSMISYVERELDKNAPPYMPPPGLHRLNRTEYANMVHDLLDLDIDPSQYLPSDDSTSGFDNITAALGLSSTLVEAYGNAAQKISRLALAEAEAPTLKVYRTPEDTSQDYHVEGLPFGTRGGLLVDHLFPSDGEYQITVTPIFGDNMSPTGFGSVPCEKLEILLDNERVDLMNWNGGGRNTPTNCGGEAPARGQGAGPNGAAAPRGAGGFGGRGGGKPMQVKVKVTAGEHSIGATFLATNFAPLLDLDQHFMRSTLQTGPTPGYTFFPHVGTIRIEGPFNAVAAKTSPSRSRIFICTPATPAQEAPCARRIITSLVTKAFRRPAKASDVDTMMEFYKFGRQDGGKFDDGIEMVLSRILASPQFIYRIEEEPAGVKPGTPYRITDIDLASRLSFFLWSTGPDDQLLKVAAANRLHEPAVLEQQVRRMLKDPKAEALSVNFAGQWLNLRGLSADSPLPLIYPDFDDPLRQAMRKEVELLFESIIREDRPVTELLDANYTFVNERLAKHYGIPNVYGSQFRRVELPKDMDFRRGLLGKGSYLVTSAKPERTAPTVRGKWIMTNILGMSPPDPPPDVPPLPPRAADPNAKEPTMRQKMETHRVRQDCTQCHSMMDPIGFSLENFDGIGLWRSHDEGQDINPVAQLFDGTKVTGPSDTRNWIVSKYSNQFVQVATEKLLVYALGRGKDWQDMPLIRSIQRDAIKNGDKFSSIVLGVVKSKPFQMNIKMSTPANTAQTADARPSTRTREALKTAEGRIHSVRENN
ncbi:MAG TPA: DUF1592 domain-containing protein [Vicinamibacterales bacterium]|nr:DUF1592 domain-containing protein [Vicinamibacterales bacterium]